jgi:predicted nucleotidyltransferase
MATLEEIKEKAVPVLEEAGITKSALFGSYVRGDQKEDSDIDILVRFPDSATLLDVVRLKRKLTQQLQKDVDIVSYNAISPLIKDSILRYQYPLL